ncbi:D-cysteine desulfhydrase family protein [Kiloniella laminariae]|uniref:D-cysteine desulfhydrase family protein n=1 Tax=Kiloniella laminariae TaxID=454162 RepID=A0ABT4LNR9_9PROT|nr:D-cysteine desulfhydrase family protein [Kiloniella laminariae]MCZ4282746.1 D-cysteine desulfhydrase family protein [Kiloniella laminariae]
MLTEFNPSISLAFLPTPLQPLDRLSDLLGGPRILIKRDDCTGLAGGGNKTRKLEFLIADALEKGADSIITAGGVQSNHVRQTAAAAARFGLDCHLVLVRNVDWADPAYQTSGNMALDYLLGAKVSLHPAGTDRDQVMEDLADKLKSSGKVPYIIPVGGSNATGALGYATATMELLEQCRQLKLSPCSIYHATSSGGTQAGLIAGLISAKRPFPVIGIEVDGKAGPVTEAIKGIVPRVLEKLGRFERWDPDHDLEVITGYGGTSYGLPTQAGQEAMELLARTEGILLDPVYSAKAFAGLIDHIRQKRFQKSDNVIFLHTGGAQAIGAYPSLFTPRATEQNL